ncbi:MULTISPECIES: putative leader peptide [unclassified Frankia]
MPRDIGLSVRRAVDFLRVASAMCSA